MFPTPCARPLRSRPNLRLLALPLHPPARPLPPAASSIFRPGGLRLAPPALLGILGERWTIWPTVHPSSVPRHLLSECWTCQAFGASVAPVFQRFLSECRTARPSALLVSAGPPGLRCIRRRYLGIS